MNKHLLIALDYKNRSKEELKENYKAAKAAADADADADAVYVAYADAAADAYAYAVAYVADADAVNVDALEYWLNRYFEKTGENIEDYEKALEDMRK